VQPLQKIRKGLMAIFLATLPYLLTPQNIERKQTHRKLFKLGHSSSISVQFTLNIVVTVRHVLHVQTTTENNNVW